MNFFWQSIFEALQIRYLLFSFTGSNELLISVIAHISIYMNHYGINELFILRRHKLSNFMFTCVKFHYFIMLYKTFNLLYPFTIRFKMKKKINLILSQFLGNFHAKKPDF